MSDQPSKSFSHQHQQLIDAIQSGEAELAYATTRLLCCIAVSEANLKARPRG